MVGQVEQMKASRCFRASRGGLGCVSCHDAHEVPAPGEKVAYFRERCLACHDDHGCKLPEPVRLARNREDYCVDCHMPVSPTVDAVHIAVRDHRILREPRAQSTAPDRTRSPFPLVRLDGDVAPEHLKSLDREMITALMRSTSISFRPRWGRPSVPSRSIPGPPPTASGSPSLASNVRTGRARFTKHARHFASIRS